MMPLHQPCLHHHLSKKTFFVRVVVVVVALEYYASSSAMNFKKTAWVLVNVGPCSRWDSSLPG
jgi:hypothetical protein